MHPLTREPEDGVTASVGPRDADARPCEHCASETSPPHEVGANGGSRQVEIDVVDGQTAACTGECGAVSTSSPPCVESLAGRRWYVSEDRLVGVDVADASGDARASAIPFTVDGKDLFQYEDANKIRLELGGTSTAAALACALGFLRARYPALRPALADEIPVEPYALHNERLVVRFNEWIEATTAEVDDEALTRTGS